MMSKAPVKSPEPTENLIDLETSTNNEKENVEDLKKKVKIIFLNKFKLFN